MLTCKQVSERASDDIDGGGSTWQRFQIRIHLMICSHCRRFRRHLIHSRDVASSVARRLWSHSDPDNAAEILRRIEDEQGRNPAANKPD